MAENNTDDMYGLVTSLCKRFTTDPAKVKRFRSLAFEILLKKRASSETQRFPDPRNSTDPVVHLMSWRYMLANRYNFKNHAVQLGKCFEDLEKTYEGNKENLYNILSVLLKLRELPKTDCLDKFDLSQLPMLEEPLDFNWDMFQLPDSLRIEADEYFFKNSFQFKPVAEQNNRRFNNNNNNNNNDPFEKAIGIVGDLSQSTLDRDKLWEMALTEKYNPNRRNWESFGYPEPEKEKPFLSELGEMSQIWVENLPSLYMAKMFKDGLVYKPKIIKTKDFVRNLKFLLTGMGSESFEYNPEGDFRLVQGISIEGITPNILQMYCKDFILSGSCYKALMELSTPNPYTNKYKQEGYIFAELCRAISEYLLFYRTAVFSLPDSINLLWLKEKTEQLRTHIQTVASICKTGPYSESRLVPHGVALLNYLYLQVANIYEKNLMMVLYSMLYPCCQVYFIRFLQPWLFEGVLNDPYDEFLIKANIKYFTSRGRTYWTRSFSVREDILPDFLVDLKTDILNCGKAMSLLRSCNSSSNFYKYLRAKKPLIISCCLTAEQLISVEKNSQSYYLEASLECGPKLSLSNAFTRTNRENSAFLDLIAEKRFATLKRLELERQKRLEELREKKLEEMATLKEQYNLAMIQKQLNICKEIEREMKDLEDAINFENMRDRILQEEANRMIEYYQQLSEVTKRRKEKIDENIRKLKSMTIDYHPPPQPLSPPLSPPPPPLKETDDSKTSLETFYSIEEESDDQKLEKEPCDPLDVLNANDDASSISLTSNGYEEASQDERAPTKRNDNELIREPRPDNESSKEINKNVQEALENFAAARRNKAKVMSQEMGIDFRPEKPALTVDTNKTKSRALTEAQANKLKVLGTEFGIEITNEHEKIKLAPVYAIGTLEMNRYRNMKSSDCFTNDNFVNKNNNEQTIEIKSKIKKSVSLALDLNKTKDIPLILPPPVPMSVDSTPLSDLALTLSTVTTPVTSLFLSVEKGQFENIPQTAETQATESSFDFLSHSQSTPEGSCGVYITTKPNFSKTVTLEEASGLSTNSLKMVLHDTVSIPLFAHMELVNSELMKFVFCDLNFMAHLASLRDYFLLNDGEFGRNLTENLFERLYDSGAPRELVNVRTLQGLVRGALENSGRHQTNSECLSFKINKVPTSFRLDDPDIFDCLSLTYRVAWPLNILLPTETIGKYDDVFKHLLKLNRAQWVLKKVNLELKVLARQTGKKEIYLMMSPQYRRLHQCRHIMMHFVQTLQSYTAGEVIQSSWTTFEKNLDTVTNFDELYIMHTMYIKNILYICLLNQKNIHINKVFQKIFVVIFKFYNYLRSRCWKCEEGAYVHPNFTKLESISNNFEELVLFLFKVGRKLSKQGSHHGLLQLLDMLDINGYYSNKLNV